MDQLIHYLVPVHTQCSLYDVRCDGDGKTKKFHIEILCSLGTSDFDAQMSGMKFWKGDENLRLVNKKRFYQILSGCLHLGLFNSLTFL